MVNAGLAALLYGPLEIAGIVLGTVAGTVVMCVAQAWLLRGMLDGVEAGRTLAAALRMLAAAALLGAVAYGVWAGLDELLGRSLAAQIVAVLGAIGPGRRSTPPRSGPSACPEARQIWRLLVSRSAAARGKTARMAPDEKMDVEKQIEALNAALRLQHRSVLLYSLTAGSVIGLEYQAHADKMRDHALAELEDATRLVEKITAIGGEPTTEVAEMDFTADPAEALDRLIESESETLETMQAAIEPTGREAASGGGRAPPRAHDHAQAGAGGLPAAGAPAAVATASRRPPAPRPRPRRRPGCRPPSRRPAATPSRSSRRRCGPASGRSPGP